jgi:hypothetical protein
VYWSEITPPVAAENHSTSPEEYTAYRYLPSGAPPDEFGCDAGSSNIDIVNLDSCAKQISWSLTDTNSDVIVDGSAYDQDDNNDKVESVTLCHSVCYEFVYNDNGDGCGKFEIVIQDDVVLSGGFLDVHKFSFCLDNNGNVRPQSGDNTGSGISIIDIDLFFEKSPDEISWTIFDTTGNRDVYGEGLNYDQNKQEMVVESVIL